MPPISIFWFRRDLRLEDNAGLFAALKGDFPVLPLFIFDTNILEELPRKDARVEFLQKTVAELSAKLGQIGSSILVEIGDPKTVWPRILEKYEVKNVFTNADWEPYARERDGFLQTLFDEKGIKFLAKKDHVIFDGSEVLKDDGKPYTVFTPYSRKWLARLMTKTVFSKSENGENESLSFYFQSYPTEKYFHNLLKMNELEAPSLEKLNFEKSGIEFPATSVARSVVRSYDQTRNFPALENGTSRLGLHFRFGTVSIREKARSAQKLNATFLNELIWRDFYSQILWHFPYVVDGPFRVEYARIDWRTDENDLEKWKKGMTGYPLVDAGMRELEATGYMHNRVRMVVASFFTKHLLMDWRLGEAHFAVKLLDFDLASNSGGWQWAAGCGTDAAPYFRIFNPTEQQKKFDPFFKYIKKWVPEFGKASYPNPMVEHVFARERCLAAYKKGLQKRD